MYLKAKNEMWRKKNDKAKRFQSFVLIHFHWFLFNSKEKNSSKQKKLEKK